MLIVRDRSVPRERVENASCAPIACRVVRFAVAQLPFLHEPMQRRHNQEHRCRRDAGKTVYDTTITPRGVHTFLLFSSLPLIADLHRAYAEDDGDEEEEDTAYDARGDGFVLNASRHGELHLVARAVIRSRVGEHLEIVGPTTDQVLHCGRSG